MEFPLNHKTIFVLDHSPVFSMTCSKVEFDFHRNRALSNYIPSVPINKNMWTCATEAVFEYCRIVYDIFPEDKLIRFVICDQENQIINTWKAEGQNLSEVAEGMAAAGRPEPETRRKKENFDISLGLKRALLMLSELTDVQKDFVEKSTVDGNNPRLVNGGRIICLTHVQDDQRMQQILEEFQMNLNQVNQQVSQSPDGLIPINKVELDVLHCFPGNLSCPVTVVETPTELTPLIRYQIFSVNAGLQLPNKLLFMALCHYGLASTTVTGIPMKEEQNSSTSANYDVELFHKDITHTQLLGESSPDLVQTVKEGCEYRTITLKWCTPRGSTADLHHCTEIARVTPTDVNSRPSSCLTNFLLSGRSVMLELPRRGGVKVLSHMLTSHGGEIFVHTLYTARSILEDPPSITEGPGGRVTDYRIPDLVEIIKSNRLAPYFADGSLEASKKRICRFTQFTPFTISATTILNMKALEPLQKIMLQEEITDSDLAECRKVIYLIINMENKGDVLPCPIQTTVSGKTKTLKKDEQYKMMYAELEKFLWCHASTDKHFKVYECLMEVRNKPVGERPLRLRENTENASKDVDRYDRMTESEKADFNMSKDGVLRSTTESPMSPTMTTPSTAAPPAAKKSRSMFGQGMTLLDIMTQKVERENSRKHVPFHGLRNLGDKAQLYMSLEKAKETESMSVDN